ncbi:lyase family protein [Nocardioides sp.]|uniref:lyase family protein n=1 Tax=Nocardioides sp. TaxID=35761 RepID=UPI002D805A0B|nr:lyase family protein [Nocardioides sp.]HET8962031.1 lyase family protein [Nocardioides sp.]
MPDLLWPGDARGDDHLTEGSFLRAMVEVESAWLDVLGVAHDPLPDLDPAAVPAEAAGNPVVELVAILRDRLEGDAARWVHRGLTSQDVVDSALMMLLRDAVSAVRRELREQIALLADLAETHRSTAMVGRTLTQHAVPTTFGLKVSGWLSAVLDADDGLGALSFPVQLGGAAGTLAAIVELGLDPARARDRLAGALGLEPVVPWHTARAPVTRTGDAAVGCTDAWGRIAGDVLVLSRPEIGELAEGSGGGSSTMPHKRNPVLSTLVRRAALAAPQLAATLHLAAADTVDERDAGAWHAEWATVAALVRRTVVAGSQATELLSGLEVNTQRMAATLAAADTGSEQRAMAELAGRAPADQYLGAADQIIDTVVDRARRSLKEDERT